MVVLNPKHRSSPVAQRIKGPQNGLRGGPRKAGEGFVKQKHSWLKRKGKREGEAPPNAPLRLRHPKAGKTGNIEAVGPYSGLRTGNL